MTNMKINETAARDLIGESKINKLHFTVFILCFFTIMGEGYDINLYGAVLPILVKDWSLSSVQAGLIGSYGMVGMMLGSIIFGWLADKYGRKKMIVISSAFYSLFTALCGSAPGVTFFSCFRFLAGMGIGGVLPNVIALATDYSPKNRQSMMVSIMLCGMQVGGILGPAASIATMDTYGWHAALWLGGIPLLLIPVMLRFMPDSIGYLIRQRKTEKVRSILHTIRPDSDWSEIELADEEIDGATTVAKAKPGLKSLFQAGRGINTVMFCAAYFMTLLMVYGLGTWMPELMIRTGYSISAGLIFPMLMNAGCICGTFLFAVIADKYLAPKKLLVLLYLTAAISLAVIGIKVPSAVQYFLACLIGAGTSGTQNIANAFVSRYYPSSVRSTGLGLCNGIGRAGAIFGTAFWGVLLAWNLPLYVDFLVFAIPALIAAASYFIARETTSAPA